MPVNNPPAFPIEKLKERLWHRDFFKEVDREIIGALVSPLQRSKYLGIDSELFDQDARYQRAIVRLLGSILIGKYLDKCIEIIVEEYDAMLKARENQP